MKRIIILALVVASTLAATPPTGGSPGQPVQPSEPGPPPMTGTAPIGGGPAAPPSSAAMLARAKTAFAQIQAGSVDRGALDAEMNAALTDDKLSTIKTAIGTLALPCRLLKCGTATKAAIRMPYIC